MNKFLYIDIGSHETKIVEAAVSGKNITLLHTAEMRDMSGFVTDSGKIYAIEGFCSSLRKTLNDAGIKATEAYVCSSIFEMQQKNITMEFKGYRDCARNFKSKYGSLLMSCDWQYIGEVVKNNVPTQQLRMTICKRTLVNRFVKGMHEFAGITVLSLESSFTASSNLAKLHKYDFETPATCVVDVDSTSMSCQYFVNGALTTVRKTNCDLSQLAEVIANKQGIGVPTATYMLYSVGAHKSLDNGSTLAASGIKSAEYYKAIDTVVTDFANKLLMQVNEIKARHQLEGIQLILTGGIFAMPGLAELVTDRCKTYPSIVAEILVTSDTRTMNIINEVGTAVSAKFGNCIGLMLRLEKEHPINLTHCPKVRNVALQNKQDRSSFVRLAKVAWTTTKITAYVIAIVLAISLLKMPFEALKPTVIITDPSKEPDPSLDSLTLIVPELSVGDINIATRAAMNDETVLEKIVYESLTPNIISVSQNGTVSALSEGQGYIRAYIGASSKIFSVAVRSKEIDYAVAGDLQISISKSFADLSDPEFSYSMSGDITVVGQETAANVRLVFTGDTDEVFIKFETTHTNELLRTVTYKDSTYTIDSPRSKFKINFSRYESIPIEVVVSNGSEDPKVYTIELVHDSV